MSGMNCVCYNVQTKQSPPLPRNTGLWHNFWPAPNSRLLIKHKVKPARNLTTTYTTAEVYVSYLSTASLQYEPILSHIWHSFRKLCHRHTTRANTFPSINLKNRNNLLMKLAGSTWGTSANTLRSSALSLCYSAAEYCAPVWSRSARTSRVDVQLNSTMRLISGTLHSIPLP